MIAVITNASAAVFVISLPTYSTIAPMSVPSAASTAAIVVATRRQRDRQRDQREHEPSDRADEQRDLRDRAVHGADREHDERGGNREVGEGGRGTTG